MANELPSNISYGTVVGRFLLAYADGPDVDLNPDGVPCGGSIVFVPSVERLRNATGLPAPVTILVRPVVCALDSEGYLLGSDNTRGVRLLATNDTDNVPVGWTWTAQYRLTDIDGATLQMLPNQTFSLSGGATLDLTTI
jgi:hypothetical protein